MKKKLLSAAIVFSVLSVVAFAFLVYGPASLVPPPNWPFTEDSRKQYQPFSEHSKLVVLTYVDDAIHGRLSVK